MTDEELLLKQAQQIKAASGNQTRVWIYRNLVKAINWYTSVRTHLDDPAFSGWFLPFRTDRSNYTSPACDTRFSPPRCSKMYHDQANMGSIQPFCQNGQCDCGLNPCGEYLWDHRNGSGNRAFPSLLSVFRSRTHSLSSVFNSCIPLPSVFYHRNGSALRGFLLETFVGGPTGLANEAVDGMYFGKLRLRASH